MNRLRHSAASFALGTTALAVLTFVCLKLQLSLTGVALLYLSIVVFVSLSGEFAAAAGVSVIAALALQYFFSAPGFSFLDAIELLVFLSTSFVISRLVATARRREQDVRLMMDALPALVSVGTPHSSTDWYCNQGFIDYTGRSQQEMRDSGRVVLLHPDEREAYASELQVALEAGRPFEKEIRVEDAHGEYHWFLNRLVPMLDEKGRITKWCATGVDIDKLKRAEASIREQAGLLQLTHDTIFVRDTNDVITYWNRGAEELYGWKPEEAIGNVSHQLTQTVFPAPLEEINAELMSTGRWEGELIHTRRDGSRVTVASRWSLQRDAQGRVIGTLETNNDIGARKRAEESVREQAGLLDLTHDTVFVRDVNDVITYWNRGAEELYGWKPEEAIGKVSHLLTQPVLPAPLEEINAELMRTGRWEGEIIHARRDGSRVTVASRWSLQRDAQGRVIGTLETNNDISARKRAEDSVREQAGLLNLTHDTIFVRDVNDVITYWNRGAEELYGWRPEEAIGKVSHQLMQTVFPAPLEQINDELMRTGRWEGEIVHTKRDGSRVTVASRWSSRRDAAGQVIGTLETNNDITDRKRAEEEIRQLQDQLYRENIALREEVDRTSMFEEIVGSSEPLRRILNNISKVAATDSTVLITGETGTGKELVARAIHKRSRRSGRAFVSVNCAAVPQSLISSELFGHEKGAFTGAMQRRLGRFELANGGTIFLDEVGELPAETQVALLRVLQEREFERVGGTQRVSVDVRVLAATNRDMKSAVDAGAFRVDLYYRLNVFPVHVPALRERIEDIPLLVEYFIQRYASKAGKKIRSIEKKTIEMFKEYEWPGNIRELQNVVERAVILCDDETFSVDDNWLQREMTVAPDDHLALPSAMDDREREMIEAALKASRGRVSGPAGAAARLGIPRTTLESKIRTLRIDKNQYRSSL